MTVKQIDKRITEMLDEYAYANEWPVACQEEYERLCAAKDVILDKSRKAKRYEARMLTGRYRYRVATIWSRLWPRQVLILQMEEKTCVTLLSDYPECESAVFSEFSWRDATPEEVLTGEPHEQSDLRHNDVRVRDDEGSIQPLDGSSR